MQDMPMISSTDFVNPNFPNANPLLLPIPPRPGDAWLFVMLDDLEHHTISQVIAKCLEMGYTPHLRYRQGKDGKIFNFLVLNYQFVASGDNPLRDEWERVSLSFPGDENSVRCPYASLNQLKQREPIPA